MGLVVEADDSFCRMDELLNDLAAGRDEAFSRLYDLLGEKLLRAGCGITGRREDAEDAVQDVFVGLVSAGTAIREVKDLKAYLFSSLHRAAARRAAKRRAEQPMEQQLLEQTTARDSESSDVEASDRLARALASLPDEQRAVVVLKIDGELTFEQIAEALNLSANTAASRYRYALEKMRAVLQPETGAALK
jgi:RNA polymerase sigma-70 factor (ECF subfamily)